MNIDKVAVLIKKAALEFDRVANPILSEYDLTSSQYKVLKFLYMQELRSAKVADIQRHYSMTHPTAIGLLENLEKKGFVESVPNPEDARSRLIRLTAKAVRRERELVHVGDEIEDRLTERLSAKERAQLVRLLVKLLGLQ